MQALCYERGNASVGATISLSISLSARPVGSVPPIQDVFVPRAAADEGQPGAVGVDRIDLVVIVDEGVVRLVQRKHDLGSVGRPGRIDRETTLRVFEDLLHV